MQLLPLLNPACSSLSWSSIWSAIRFRIIVASTLVALLRMVMPLQFSHCDRSPFFGNFITIPSFHDFGISSLDQICVIDGSRILANTSGSVFSNSAGIPSIPSALLFFSFSIASLTSLIVGGLIFILLLYWVEPCDTCSICKGV